MGYSRKSLQILGGGFSCLPPVDKTPQTDYLLAQNWRSDALGRLISRQGGPSKFNIPGAGIAHSASNAGGAESPYYVGCNSAVLNPTSALYYDGIQIATGFDGNRIGFAAQNGFMWVMNRGKQGRHSVTGGFKTWNLTPPKASVTTAPAAVPGTVGSVTYTYNLTGDAAYLHYLTLAGVTYSFPENGYSATQIPQLLSILAQADANCSVTYDGLSQDLTITPIPPFTLIAVSGSDGNANANVATGAITSLPNGTYQYYLTFQDADGALESNPGPVSAIAISVAGQSIVVTIPAADAPTDARIHFVNIYRTGGTLGSAYRVGQKASTVAVPATTFTDSMSDLDATNAGQTMPIDHDSAPAASGMLGPHYSRLFAWSTAAKKNRLFYTNPNLPQYWPGSSDEQIGNWVDVGLDDEAIVWCSVHGNLLVIYKERSIWVLLGDPATGTLGQSYDGLGLANAFALAPAGLIDYFVGPNGLYLFDMDKAHAMSGNILPLFNTSITNAGPLTPPGSVLPGTAFNSTSLAPYAIALGHALGRLYIAYAENGTGAFNLLIFDEGPLPEVQASLVNAASGRWFYHRNAIAGAPGFFGFFFDGVSMTGLTGIEGGAARGFSLSDFRGFLAADEGATPIECVYQSHYENAGLPDNDKMWLEVTIDFEFSAGASAAVYAGFSNGETAPVQIGTLSAGPRRTVAFGMPNSVDGGVLAKNMSVLVDASTTGNAVLHNVFLYYYAEARLALVASTMPTDLGIGKDKECKELQLDITAFGGVAVAIQSDLPGNALLTRQTPNVAAGGRAVFKYPFPVTEGFLWQVVLVGGPFRLYSVRLLMRVIGVFVEGYESAAGFRWDSMQIALGAGEVSTLDQVRFEMEAGGAASVELLTDLPGEASASRGVFALTLAATTRSWVTVPLPEGIEARSVQVQVTGDAGYRLYRAQVRHNRVGRFLMGTAPNGRDDAFNTLEFDFASERISMFKRLEFDLRADGTVNVEVITNQDGLRLATIYAPALVTPNGRETLLVAMPPGVRGRLLRVKLSGTAPARIYRIRVWARAVAEPRAIWAWQEFPLEASDVLPSWVDFVVEETPPVWQLVDVPFEVTEGP